ncbi:pilus assembly FimT family protein [Petrocella sp. FN5]|uniref:pilus assembly FimT family protein n=1 Tax=Petrocella sp. FN5 TaxID=3032002 RepID=UPI0023DC7B27|nr:prepilin-type N-terminal cleavage/methylation domain-containing protein [Petrocella sp. FN5]MDF1617025.1 prepilin-type N-terminal cleavage/methylation domain-containing protein [Petrocella sp. FN5]
MCVKSMNNIKRQDGYTLIEMIIVMALLAIAIGLSGFGLNTLYTNNINTYSNQLISEIKLVQTKEMASKDKDYRLTLTYDSTLEQYIGRTLVRVGTTGTYSTLKTIKLPKKVAIKKWDGTDYVDIQPPNYSLISFEFDSTSGQVKNTANGDGRYEISSTASSRVIEFEVIKQNGRVVMNE